MTQRLKIGKLLAESVPVALEAEGAQTLNLKLAWTMRGVILTETKARELGLRYNILQRPDEFWKSMDATTLAIAVWAMASQEQPETTTDDGFDLIASYLTVDNMVVAALALKAAYLKSLSEKMRKELEEGIKAAAEEDKAPENPTPAPATA